METEHAKTPLRVWERFSFPVLLIFIVIVAVFCIGNGSAFIKPIQTISILWEQCTGVALVETSEAQRIIVLQLRLPRVLLAALVGSSLSLSGAAMQGLIRNPLADGSTLGVTSGASLGAVLCIALGWQIPAWPQLSTALFGIAFSVISLIIILLFARRMDADFSSSTIILSGVIFSMLAGSLTSLIIAFAGDSVREIVFWSMGSLSGRSWDTVGLLLGFVLVGQGLILANSRELDALSLGEEQAAYIGVDVRRARMQLLLGTAVLCGATVSLCGHIAFVGLIVPHVVRQVTGPLNRRLLPRAALLGALFLMLCDLAARMVMQPLELPIGVITSIIGALVLMVVFYHQRPKG